MSKWTGKQYLDASLEDVLERANSSQHQSEIPFVSAVLAAKANRDQKKSASLTLITAVVSVVVAALALFNSIYIQSKSHTQKADFIKEAERLNREVVSLRAQVLAAEQRITTVGAQVSALNSEQARMGSIIQSAISTVPIHIHEVSPSTEEALTPKNKP